MATRRVTAKDGAAAIALIDRENRAARATALADAALAATRKCIGSAKFGIEAHEAPVVNFPVQPSQKDGIGRMCHTHWKEYVRGLTRARKALKGAAPICSGWVATIAVADKRAAARRTEGEQIAEVVDAAITRLAASEALRETPAVTARRAKFEAKLAEVGVASDEGQRILEEAVVETVVDALRLAKLPETLAEVETPEAQDALEAAANAARFARRGGARSARKAAADRLPSANSQGDAG